MIITRKIEIYVYDTDPAQKKNYMQTLYSWRDYVRKAANLIVSHKFVQMNVRDFMYMQDDVLERLLIEEPARKKINPKTGKEIIKYNISDILRKGKGCSEQNTTYRLVSSMLKGKMNSDIYSCLNQVVCNTFKETSADIYKGDASLRSYKNNIPIPFSAKTISNIHPVDEEYMDRETFEIKKTKRYYFTLFGIPFCLRLGQDRSNNQSIIDNMIKGIYKLCSSSIGFEKTVDRLTGQKKQKLFLYLCVDIPKAEEKTDKNKIMYAYLGIDVSIRYSVSINAKKKYDSGTKFFDIGSKEEFLHRRLQIQEAVRRCQTNNKYNCGGRGRKRKTAAIKHWHNVEENYVNYKMHVYSRELINRAIKYKCGKIVLLNQSPQEEEAKLLAARGQPFLLRNWSYFGLKTKIQYKADKVGIEIISDKSSVDETEN